MLPHDRECQLAVLLSLLLGRGLLEVPYLESLLRSNYLLLCVLLTHASDVDLIEHGHLSCHVLRELNILFPLLLDVLHFDGSQSFVQVLE